jgi:hypothetical protein
VEFREVFSLQGTNLLVDNHGGYAILSIVERESVYHKEKNYEKPN